MENATKSWRHHDFDDTMYRRHRFENANIGIGVCFFFYACKYQTTQPIVVKILEMFTHSCPALRYKVNIKVSKLKVRKRF